MKFSRLYLLPLAILFLVGCATSQLQAPIAEKIDWQQQQQTLNKIKQWSISGRIAVQTTTDGGQADYSWQQINNTDYNIRLQAPLGAGTTWIEGRAQGVKLHNSSGEALFNSNVDELMLQMNGWPLPVSGLRSWVLGLPSQATTYKVTEWQANDLPRVMLQDGWRIEFRQYKKEVGTFLPHKLFIRSLDAKERAALGMSANEKLEEVDVRLIIRQWSIGGV